MCKKLFILFIFINLCCVLYAQQITRFAIVDLPRVYQAFFRESRAVRQFEERSARVQNDIDRITREIQELRSRQADAALRGDDAEALRLEAQANRRAEFLRDFHQTRTAELENERRRLTQPGAFLDEVYSEIRFIAESEGFSAVFNLSETRGLLWHSPTVDITDRVIASLQARNRRN